MIAKLFLTLTDYPWFRRLMWKPIYETLAKKFKVDNWHFMNYGYMPFDHEKPLVLENKEEINRYSIQLYHYLASKVNIGGCDVLEVGSGRGGGAAHITKYLLPKTMTGLDIAHNAVQWSNEKHGTDKLKFVQGSAEHLPFGNETFDVVTNVESCHAYGSVPKFLSEVERVLRKNGYFLCTDIRSPEGMKILRNHLQQSGMQFLEEEDITNNVIKAIETEEPLKQQRIDKDVPKWFQKAFKEFAGVKGSKIHEDLKSRTLIYYRFLLKK
ncbi:MAG: class I SAM-dependent methyltransferase [Chitinophagaceae bacterium]